MTKQQMQQNSMNDKQAGRYKILTAQEYLEELQLAMQQLDQGLGVTNEEARQQVLKALAKKLKTVKTNKTNKLTKNCATFVLLA